MLNRNMKTTCVGHQTKESIIKHSKEYPHLINVTKHFDEETNVRVRKGFHHLPSYKSDVAKVAKDLLQEDVFNYQVNRKLKCKQISKDKYPFDLAFSGLRTMIHRHEPKVPYHRLRDRHV